MKLQCSMYRSGASRGTSSMHPIPAQSPRGFHIMKQVERGLKKNASLHVPLWPSPKASSFPALRRRSSAIDERGARNGFAGPRQQRNGEPDLLMGALALCLLVAGYLVAKQAFGEVGLRVVPSGLQVNHTREIEPDQTQPVLQRCFPARDIRTVIAQYFDMYLLPGEHPPKTPIYRAASDSALRFECKDQEWDRLGLGS
jgi:hypothetical protein